MQDATLFSHAGGAQPSTPPALPPNIFDAVFMRTFAANSMDLDARAYVPMFSHHSTRSDALVDGLEFDDDDTGDDTAHDFLLAADLSFGNLYATSDAFDSFSGRRQAA